MFSPWIKRKSLKRSSRSKSLIVNGESPSRIMLLSLTALCMMVGIYAVQHSLADSVPASTVTSTPTVTPSPSPSASLSPTVTPEAR